MQGSIFPDSVLIDHVALRRTELTKAAEILRGRTDWTSRGMFSGGAISVNAIDGTKIDVAQLSGFAPNGEFLETDSDYYSIALNSYVLNAINYVVAVYSENSTYLQPHESNGLTFATCAEMAWRIRVYEESVFNALPATDPNILNDAIDRCLIIGKVTANGPGVVLTTSNIFSPTSYAALLYSNPMTFTTIPGVQVLAISSDTVPGSATLQHYALAGPTHYLRYNAPNMAVWPVCPPNVPPGFGWVEITADGNYSLAGSAGTFMTVQVILSMLPSVLATTTTASLDVYNLYYQEIPRNTAIDDLHRSMIGTGIIKPTNPHGLSVSDLSGYDLGLLEEHIDVQHSNGFAKISSASCAQATISFPLTADQLNLVPMVGVDAYYCNGKRVTSFAPTSFMFEPAIIPSSTSGTHLYEVYLSDDGVSAVHHKAMIDESGGPRTITGVWPVDMSPSYPASAGLALNLTVGAVYEFSFNGGEVVLVPLAADSQIIRLYDYTSEGWLDLLVNTNDPGVLSPDGNLPGVGVYADSLIVYASPDWTQNLQIASVCGWWDAFAGPARFAIGYKPYTPVLRAAIDKRPWGTLDTEVMSDSALQEITWSQQDELHESGVLYRRNTAYQDFQIYGAAGLNLSIRGGGLYCRGKRIDYAGTTQALFDNVINLLYVDAGGTLRVLDVTTDFAASIPDAVNYVIGSTHLTPWVSSVYEATDLTDSPERGVVLYAITTAGGAITSTVNLMRNVNGPVMPWSVSSFTASSALSAFDSLYSAFLYASLRASQDYTIEVLLNGPSTIDATITQPVSVNVRGKNNSSAVDVTITVADASGAWRLSNGCKISDAQIYMGVDSGVAIGLTSNTTVERCIYFASAALTNDVFLKAAAACSNVRVVGNKVTTRSSMITGTNASNYNIWVEDNAVLQSPNSIVSSLIELYGKNIFIKNNKLTTDNSVVATSAISGTLSGDYLVDGNDIELGTSADAAFNYGINLNANTSYVPRIINNTLKRVTGSASHVGIGIYVVNGGAIIRGNSITGMGGGVWVCTNTLPYAQIEGNAVGAGYHFGLQVSTNAGSWSVADDVTVRGNTVTGMVKNAGGSGGGLFGDDLYGIWIRGGIVAGISSGNMIVSDNTITSLSNAIDNVSGIYASYSFVLGGNSSFDGISIVGNSIKTVLTPAGGGTSQGVYLSFYAAAGAASTLGCRCISVSNNNVRGILSTDEDAYGIYCKFDLDSGHTTGLNGLAVNGNNVAGFWGDTADPTSTSAGVHVENAGSIGDTLSFSCSNNTIGTTSALIVAPGTDNDDTFVYGLYSNLESGVLSGNSISISGTTERGDGIRAYPTGAVTFGLVKLVVSNNAIDVPWTGIQLKGVTGYAIASVAGNRINAKSVGIYSDARVFNSSIDNNTIYVSAVNACEYTGCTLDGVGCIVSADSYPNQTVISGNNLTMLENLNSWSANIWLYGAVGCSVSGNRTYQDGAVPVADTVFHIRAVDSGIGITTISNNTVDNRARLNATGIEAYQSASDIAAVVNVCDNMVYGCNAHSGLAPWEFNVNIGGCANPQYFVRGNTVYGVGITPAVNPTAVASNNPSNTHEDNAENQVLANVRSGAAPGTMSWW